jgi:hypothetical protein
MSPLQQGELGTGLAVRHRGTGFDPAAVGRAAAE